jgi:mannose-6-phosphate isomerase-like protein (cupin superfamily)
MRAKGGLMFWKRRHSHEKRRHSDETPCCSFCAKEKDKAGALISSPSNNEKETPVYICAECVEVCSAILEDRKKGSGECKALDAFPEFMKSPANRIASGDQATPGVEGYVFDGADGSQMAYWTCHETTESVSHVHDFDEYMLVVEGCYTLVIGGERIPVRAREEYFIPRGVPHSGEVVAGTRTIHAFGGHRADRAHPS